MYLTNSAIRIVFALHSPIAMAGFASSLESKKVHSCSSSKSLTMNFDNASNCFANGNNSTVMVTLKRKRKFQVFFFIGTEKYLKFSFVYWNALSGTLLLVPQFSDYIHVLLMLLRFDFYVHDQTLPL